MTPAAAPESVSAGSRHPRTAAGRALSNLLKYHHRDMMRTTESCYPCSLRKHDLDTVRLAIEAEAAAGTALPSGSPEPDGREITWDQFQHFVGAVATNGAVAASALGYWEMLPPAAAGTALDVERLARALEQDFGPSYFLGLHDVTIIGKTPLEIAQKVAAEYARLAGEEK